MWRFQNVWVLNSGQILIHTDKNQTPRPHHGFWGCHSQWLYYASISLPYIPSHSTQRAISMCLQAVTLLNREGNCWKTMSGNKIVPCQDNPILALRKLSFCDYTTLYISLPNSPDYNPRDYYGVGGTVKQETNKISCNTKDKLKPRIMVTFKQGDCQISFAKDS